MASTAAPYGLIPTKNRSGVSFQQEVLTDGVLSTYGTTIYSYQLVKMATGGVLQAAAAGDAAIGVFLGVEYTATNGTRVTSNVWIASSAYTAGTCKAYYTSDPFIIYQIQCDGSLAQTSIGDMADITNATAGNALTGYSATTISATLVGAGNSAQLQILELAPLANNAWGDAFTDVLVRINEHQFLASNNAI